MNQCNNISHTAYKPSSSAKPFKTAPEMKKDACHNTVSVHDSKGNDSFNESFERPMKTIQAALFLTRILRASYDSGKTLCIAIRRGIYYLETNATTSSSQIGAMALTINNSNLLIENYQNERVVLSGGTLLQLKWSVHAKTAAGNTIMKAQVPSFVNLDHFSELYIDGTKAIVAKYPNGDLSTHGLYATDPGFSLDSQGWIPSTANGTVDIQVQEPSRNGTILPTCHIGLGDGASVFSPPRSIFGAHSVPRGFTVKNGALPHIKNCSKPTTGFFACFSW